MKFIAAILLSYLAGCFPSAYIVAQKKAEKDIYSEGSKNPGASNVYRVMGPKWAILVLLFDMLKGYLPVRLATNARVRDLQDPWNSHPEAVRAILGLAAISGHIWPVTHGFKGGKGVNASMGSVITLMPIEALVAFSVFLREELSK